MKLDQTCQSCGLTEAAGAYCTRCFRPTSEADKHRPRQSESARGRKAPLHRHESADAA